MDSPELTRAVVLLVALADQQLLGNTDRSSDELAPILRELDALNVRLMYRSRSAVRYDLTTRGEAALADAEQIRGRLEQLEPEQLAAERVTVELEDRKWSVQQVNGPMLPDMEPDLVERRTVDVSGFRFLSAPPEKEEATTTTRTRKRRK